MQWNTMLQKEGITTIHNSMARKREHYAEWNKPIGERQIPYDLTYKWNLSNKTKNPAKYNQRRGNKEQTDIDQRGGGKRITGKHGEGSSRNMYKGPMHKDNVGVWDWIWEVWVGRAGESNGGKMGATVIEQFKKERDHVLWRRHRVVLDWNLHAATYVAVWLDKSLSFSEP